MFAGWNTDRILVRFFVRDIRIDWLGELEGISRADTSKVKAFASRSVDRSRPAYGHFIENHPRQNIFIGTTNDDKYLRDMTGNRRFWPVKTGAIDLDGLRRDRDQLWAEAAHLEKMGESIVLPESLWLAAMTEQEARLEDDPWLDTLSRVGGQKVGNHMRISSTELMTSILGIPVERQQQYQTKRLAGIMRKLGWDGPKLIKFQTKIVARGYERLCGHEEPNNAESINHPDSPF